MKREEEDAREKSVDFLHFGSFLIVLSDSEVRFVKIRVSGSISIDFQSILTVYGHFQKSNFSTPASYLAPSLNVIGSQVVVTLGVERHSIRSPLYREHEFGRLAEIKRLQIRPSTGFRGIQCLFFMNLRYPHKVRFWQRLGSTW